MNIKDILNSDWFKKNNPNWARNDLSMANLRGANLSMANLSMANLSMANLREANLRGADLSEANLRGAKNVPEHPESLVPNQGDLIVWKKTLQGIVKLLIPSEAKRSSATSRKCRAEYAIVMELPPGIKAAYSMHDKTFVYELGKTVRPTKPFDNNRWNECGSGIHFFVTRDEAEQY